jgi:hypothetical protein
MHTGLNGIVVTLHFMPYEGQDVRSEAKLDDTYAVVSIAALDFGT